MGFMLKEEKENLLTEYDLLREEIWDRDYKTWVVNAILIVGSLIAAFSISLTSSFPTPVLSLVLVISAIILQITSERVTAISYERIGEIEKKLNITGPAKMYQSKIANQWWYVIRKNVAYVMFTVLASIYLFLIFDRIYVLAIAIIAGLILIIIKETSFRQGEKTQR
jgi:hypothetical protein